MVSKTCFCDPRDFSDDKFENLPNSSKKCFSKKTPTIVRDLLPGTYSIKIVLKGFKPWVKKLKVQGTKATLSDNILLIPKIWSTRELTRDSFQDLIPFAGHPFFILRKGPLLKDFFLCRWTEKFKQNFVEQEIFLKNNEMIPLIAPDSPWAQAKVLELHTVYGSPFLFIEAQENDVSKFFWVNLKVPCPVIKDISVFFPNPFEKISWDPNTEKTLYSLHNGALNAMNLSSQTITTLINGIRTFTVHNNYIYALPDDYLIQRIQENAKNTLLLENHPPGVSLFERHEIQDMSVFSEDLVIFLTKGGGLFLNQPPYKLMPQNIEGFAWDKGRERLLVWRYNDIGFLDLTETLEEGILQKVPALTWMNISPQDVQQALWINNGAQILFIADNTVFVTETKSFGQPQAHEVVKIKPQTGIAFFEAQGRLFFLEPQMGHLMSVKIVPKD